MHSLDIPDLLVPGRASSSADLLIVELFCDEFCFALRFELDPTFAVLRAALPFILAFGLCRKEALGSSHRNGTRHHLLVSWR
jgi:hypothetical protein